MKSLQKKKKPAEADIIQVRDTKPQGGVRRCGKSGLPERNIRTGTNSGWQDSHCCSPKLQKSYICLGEVHCPPQSTADPKYTTAAAATEGLIGRMNSAMLVSLEYQGT